MSVTIDGTSGVTLGSGDLTFPDATSQTTAPTQIGVGQTWQAVTRTAGVTYTNTTGKPILWAIRTATSTSIVITVQGVNVFGTLNSGASDNQAITIIVPNNATYSYTSGSGSTHWELR